MLQFAGQGGGLLAGLGHWQFSLVEVLSVKQVVRGLPEDFEVFSWVKHAQVGI